jgi:hypothetical protein
MNWMGWTRSDNTTQKDTFFHVDDFAEIGPGVHGHLIPIEGTKSMWCGARSNEEDPYLCAWKTAPGYGHNWEQYLTSQAFSFVGKIYWSYYCNWDSEDGQDVTYTEYDAGNGNWQVVDEWTGTSDTTRFAIGRELMLPQVSTKLRYRFSSDSNTDDEDGLLNSDGAFIVDDIGVLQVDPFNLLDVSTFENVPVGATSDGFWTASPATGYGTFSGLRTNLMDQDPCNSNFGTQVVFFVGSPNPSLEYPGLFDTPFCDTWQCQDELVISPVIDLTRHSTAFNEVQDAAIPPDDLPLLGKTVLGFTVYRHLPLSNLVFYKWHVRVIGPEGCPGPWMDRGFLYYGGGSFEGYCGWGMYYAGGADYQFAKEDISDLVGNESIQVALGVVDMYGSWSARYNCTGLIHTPAPWFDNVNIKRFDEAGPHWSYRDIDLFQDNFPGDNSDIESYVRADMAQDIDLLDYPGIRPGDSIVVSCASPLGGGIAAAGDGPAVYLHVKCSYLGPEPAKPTLYGPALQGTYGAYVSTDGTWTIIQCDSARGPGGSMPTNRWAVDLNDSLLTRGYMIEYYFTAQDNNGAETALPKRARSRGPYFEFTCLPTGSSDILFVDDFSGRGTMSGTVEDYWTSAFEVVLPENNQPDRYDVNGPSSGVSNGPGSRASYAQLADWYCTIIWDSGDLERITITDGTTQSDKSNDCQLLMDWMDHSAHRVGLWVCGDDVAYDLTVLASGTSLGLLSTHCGVVFLSDSHGGFQNPRVGGWNPSIFSHGGVPDRFRLEGGCPIVNKFDALDKTENGVYQLQYIDTCGGPRIAAVSSEWVNSHENSVRTLWFGFSCQYIRDDVLTAPNDRFDIVRDVLQWFQNATNADITHADVPRAYKLAQNYPNPFNPVTSIRFDMKEKGVVTLKIYNVAGQLVRTLLDGVKAAGSYSVAWDGKNNRGAGVGSGIYFYKMEAKGFSATKKMVILR